MKKTMKRILAMMLVVVMTIGAAPLSGFVGLELPDIPEFNGLRKLASSVSDFFDGFLPEAKAVTSGKCGDNITWTFDESTGTLTISGTGEMWDWTYPSREPWNSHISIIKNISISNGVTSIGDEAFHGCTRLVSITIPDGITSIGEMALYNCDRLTSITIPDSVTSIGDLVFCHCDSLASVTIGDGVTSIGEGAFDYCDNLTNITVDSANTAYSNDEYGVLFNKDKIELIQYPVGNARTSYTIPDSVTSIGDYAFHSCDSLASVTIGNSVKIIDSSAFDNCDSLASITIPNSVTSIGREAFYSCDSLASVTIGNSITSIGDWAFYNCYSLASVTIPDSVTSIGNSAFHSCNGLASVTIGNSVTSIGDSAFYSCDSFTNVYYTGTEEEWNAISIGSYNSDLINATFHFNYEAEKLSTEEIIDIYVENKDVWKEEYNTQFYGFVDFDGDGILELVSSRNEGSVGVCYNRYFKINISENSVFELVSNDGIDWPSAKLLKDRNEELSYLGLACSRDSGMCWESFSVYSSLYLNNNSLNNTNRFFVHYISSDAYYNETGEDIYEYNYHGGVDWVNVSKQEYYNRYNEFMRNYTDLNATFDFRQLTTSQKTNDTELKTVLTEMYNGFSYNELSLSTPSIEEIIDIYVQNKDVWMIEPEEQDRWIINYGFFDLNHDGKLELFSYGDYNNGRYYQNNIYSVDTVEKKLIELSLGNQNNSFFGYGLHDLKLLKNNQTHKLEYVYSSAIDKVSAAEYRVYTGTLKQESNNINSTSLFCEHYLYGDVFYSYYNNGKWIEVSKEEYDKRFNDFMSNYTDLNATFDFRQLTTSQKTNDTELKTVLTEMYNGFSYDNVNEKSIAVFSTERSLCVENGESIWLAFGLVENGELSENWRKMAVTVSDNSIISLSEYEETEYGYSLEVYGKNIGSTHVTITDTASGATTVIVINVRDSYVSTSSYSIDNVPKFFPNSITESDIETNIYNMNGLYVNKYNCQKNGDLYNVSFDIYNERYHTGAVDVFDSNGKWLGSEEIEKYSDISSLWDTGEQLVYMVYDFVTCKMLTYQQAASSKYTHIDIKVPEGGYFTISNNFAESVGTFMFNGCEILYEGVSAIIDLAVKGIDSHEFTKLITGKIKDNPKIRDEIFEIFIESVDDEIRKYTKNILDGNINDAYLGISGLFENMLNSADFNWRHLAEFGVGVTEEILAKLFGPAGLALKGCFSITKGTNKFLQAIHIARSVDKTYATIYSSINEGYINSNGIIVNTNRNIDTEAVLQVFRVSNNNSVEEILNSSNKLEKYELYNICFVKDDTLVQPNGKVTVYVPIPKGMKGNTCKIYRQEANGNWTVLDAHIEENHLVFETDHFSLYAVIGESGGVSFKSPPVKLEYEIGEVLDVSGLILDVNGEEVTSGFLCDPTAFAETGKQKITVRYGCSDTEFYVNVKEKTHFHSYTSSVIMPETCTENGVMTYTCSCGDSYTETISATGHTQGSWVTSIEPSCTEDGEKIIHCTVCDVIITSDIIPATGHFAGTWTVIKEATCTAEGERIRKCLYCGEVVETEKIPVTAHTPGTWIVSVNPTCTETGEKTRKCSGCGKVLEISEIPATGHTAGSWETILEPTTDTEGKMVKRCTVCKVTLEERNIPVVEDEIEVWIQNPSKTTINYGDSIILHAESDKVLPAGYSYSWMCADGKFAVEPNGDTCKITPVTSGDTTITLILADENGTPIDSAKQTMTSKAGFFDKIIAFFKGIFGLNKTYPSVF